MSESKAEIRTLGCSFWAVMSSDVATAGADEAARPPTASGWGQDYGGITGAFGSAVPYVMQ